MAEPFTGGLLQNPFFAIGSGLMQSAGNPLNPYGGISTGLMAAQNARQAQTMDDFRRRQMEAIDAQEQERQRKIAEAAQQRQRQEEFLQSQPPEMRRLLAAYPQMIGAVLEAQMKPPPERKTVKGADGFLYYQDDGSRVLPDVQKPQEQMTSYQREQIRLKEAELAMKNLPDPADAAEAEKRSQAKVQQNQIAINTIDQAIDTIDNNFFASGMASNLVPDSLSGTSEQALRGQLSTIQSAIGLQRLLDVKAQGGTFGALSERELDLLTSSLSSLSPDLPTATLRKNLETVKSLLQKANVEEIGLPDDEGVFQYADAILDQ